MEPVPTNDRAGTIASQGRTADVPRPSWNDIQDRALVLQQWGTPGNGKTDFNRDGIVNMFDLLTVLQNFGSGCTP